MKKEDTKTVIPDWIVEIGNQIKEQPKRCTAHPLWQVRCKEYIVTEEGYNDHHWILCCDDGEFFRSDIDEPIVAAEFLSAHYTDWFLTQVKEQKKDEFFEDFSDEEVFADAFDYSYETLPYGVNRIFVQEVEKVVSTHLTQNDANWFIERKQYDYPNLYTYIESAYWSPQIKKLQDWLVSLT